MGATPNPSVPTASKLIRFNYITQDWVNLIPNPWTQFVSTIAPKLSTIEFYPAPSNIFRAFKECPEDTLKVVFLSQDPYPGSYKINNVEFPQATGLAFDNSLLQPNISGSLRNMLKELSTDIPNHKQPEISYLGHLPSQGVLLLNTALTVIPGEANSHKELWKEFTEEIIKGISEKKDNIVWVLLGAQAQSYESLITNPTHKFVKAVHPSPLSANRGFFGSKIFTKINEALTELGHNPISF